MKAIKVSCDINYSERFGYTLVPVLKNDKEHDIYILGGTSVFTSSTKISFLVYNIEAMTISNKFHKGDFPPPTSFHTSVKYKDFIFLFGGINIIRGKISTSSYRFNLKTSMWEEVNMFNYGKIESSTIISKDCYGHTATILNDDVVIQYGGAYYGEDKDQTSSSDLYEFHLEKQYMKPMAIVGPPPPPRHFHSALYLPAKNSLVIYGGITLKKSKRKILGDLHLFRIDLAFWMEVYINSVPRFGANLLSIWDRVYLLGGGFNEYYYIMSNTIDTATKNNRLQWVTMEKDDYPYDSYTSKKSSFAKSLYLQDDFIDGLITFPGITPTDAKTFLDQFYDFENFFPNIKKQPMKVSLCGIVNSGKSTFLTQIKIFKDLLETESELTYYRGVLRRNLFDVMTALCQKAPIVDQSFSLATNSPASSPIPDLKQVLDCIQRIKTTRGDKTKSNILEKEYLILARDEGFLKFFESCQFDDDLPINSA